MIQVGQIWAEVILKLNMSTTFDKNDQFYFLSYESKALEEIFSEMHQKPSETIRVVRDKFPHECWANVSGRF